MLCWWQYSMRSKILRVHERLAQADQHHVLGGIARFARPAFEIPRPSCPLWAACGSRAGTWGSTDCTWRWSRRYTPPAARRAWPGASDSPTAIWRGSRPSCLTLLYLPGIESESNGRWSSACAPSTTQPVRRRRTVCPVLVPLEPARGIQPRAAVSRPEMANRMNLPLVCLRTAHRAPTLPPATASTLSCSKAFPRSQADVQRLGAGYIFQLPRRKSTSDAAIAARSSRAPPRW